jgi:hypothetical protein
VAKVGGDDENIFGGGEILCQHLPVGLFLAHAGGSYQDRNELDGGKFVGQGEGFMDIGEVHLDRVLVLVSVLGHPGELLARGVEFLEEVGVEGQVSQRGGVLGACGECTVVEVDVV